MEKTTKQNGFNNFQNKYYGLENEFKFSQGRMSPNGVIFIASALIVPFLLMLIMLFVFDLQNNQSAQTLFQVLQMGTVTAGFVVLSVRIKNYVKSGKGALFFYTVLPVGIAILFATFYAAIVSDSKYLEEIFNIIIMIVATVVVLIIAFLLDRDLQLNLQESFKKKFLPIFTTAVIATIVMFGVSIVIQQLERLWTPESESDNQAALQGVLFNDSYSKIQKIVYACFLFVYSVLIAPLVEEVVFRYVWNKNVDNKWWGFVTSAIYFGFLHYGSTGDVAHALSYTSGGFVLAGLFIFTKGNTLSVWMTHFFNNLIAFGFVIASAFWGK